MLVNQAAAKNISAGLKYSILKTLAYFDMFNYPLSENEILFFCDKAVSIDDIKISLADMSADGSIFLCNGFYSLHNGTVLAQKRVIHNDNAQLLLPIAKNNSCFLFQFPFVRGIGISGSLSKNVATEDSDIDYFVITKTNRMWIARTIMHLFKKLSFLVGKEHLYCMNYYIDETALEIEEKNIFTAVEIATLLPVCGNGTMDKFVAANNWINVFHPNSIYRKKLITSSRNIWLKRLAEYLFNNGMGDRIDDYFMRLTLKRWNKKEQLKMLNGKGELMGLKLGKHFCKPNPVYFQQKLLARYVEKLNSLHASLKSIK
jgi:hypothetical protein